MQETSIRFLGWEDPLEKEMTMHSSILAWIIPWTEEPGGYNPWSHKELDTTEQTNQQQKQQQQTVRSQADNIVELIYEVRFLGQDRPIY